MHDPALGLALRHLNRSSGPSPPGRRILPPAGVQVEARHWAARLGWNRGAGCGPLPGDGRDFAHNLLVHSLPVRWPLRGRHSQAPEEADVLPLHYSGPLYARRSLPVRRWHLPRIGGRGDGTNDRLPDTPLGGGVRRPLDGDGRFNALVAAVERQRYDVPELVLLLGKLPPPSRKMGTLTSTVGSAVGDVRPCAVL